MRVIIFFILIVILNLSCSEDKLFENLASSKDKLFEPSDLVNSESRTVQFSGKDLYLGIIHFRGDVAAKVPSLNKIKVEIDRFNSENLTKLNNFNDSICYYIEIYDPHFFQNFKNDIYSNNVIKIESAIQSAVRTTIVATTLFGNNIPLTEIEKQFIKDQSLNYNLTDKSQFLAFLEIVNNHTSLDLDIEMISSSISQISSEDDIAKAPAYAAVYIVLGAVALSAVAAVHAVVAYAGVFAVEAVYVYSVTKWWAPAPDNFFHELLISEIVTNI